MGKYCTRCGSQINENAKFCSRCGARNEVTVNNTVQHQVGNNQSAINTKGFGNNTVQNNPINNNYNNDNVIYTPKTNNVAICSLLVSIIGIFVMSMHLRSIFNYMWYRCNK